MEIKRQHYAHNFKGFAKKGRIFLILLTIHCRLFFLILAVNLTIIRTKLSRRTDKKTFEIEIAILRLCV